MKRLPVCLLALSVLSGSVGAATVAARSGAEAHASGSHTLARAHEGQDGFTFSYPAGWFVDRRPIGTPSALTSFKLSVACCHMADGQLKVDFWSMPLAEARRSALTYEQRCAGTAGERVVSCETYDSGTVEWGWVRVSSNGTLGLYALAEHDGRAYVAAGIVPDGPRAEHGIEQLRDIFRTFRIR